MKYARFKHVIILIIIIISDKHFSEWSSLRIETFSYSKKSYWSFITGQIYIMLSSCEKYSHLWISLVTKNVTNGTDVFSLLWIYVLIVYAHE